MAEAENSLNKNLRHIPNGVNSYSELNNIPAIKLKLPDTSCELKQKQRPRNQENQLSSVETPLTSLLNFKTPRMMKFPNNYQFPFTPTELQNLSNMSAISTLTSLSSFYNLNAKDAQNSKSPLSSKTKLVERNQPDIASPKTPKVPAFLQEEHNRAKAEVKTELKLTDLSNSPTTTATTTPSPPVPMVQCASNSSSKVKIWKKVEEIFLIGCVMDRFFKRGSLASTRTDASQKKNGQAAPVDSCWETIKKSYDKAWLRFAGEVELDRSAQSLARHYKVMKSKLSPAGASNRDFPMENFRDIFIEWERIYNIDNRLMLSDEEYENYTRLVTQKNKQLQKLQTTNSDNASSTQISQTLKRHYDQLQLNSLNAMVMHQMNARDNKRRHISKTEDDLALASQKLTMLRGT